MSEIEGEHGASDALMRDPERLVRLYAEGLKAVHSVSAADCPFDRRLRVKMDEAHNGLGDYAPLFAVTYGLPEFDPGKVEFLFCWTNFFDREG